MSDILYFWHAHWCSAAAATLLYLRNLQQKTEKKKKKHQQQQKPKQENKGGKRNSPSEVLTTLKLGCFPRKLFSYNYRINISKFLSEKSFFFIIRLFILDFQV